MPLTVQFGAWSPDQADTPLQVQDTQGPVTVPCADCLNVIYSNGSYRSIASPTPATIDGSLVAGLSVQALSGFSFFDDVAQQETVFVGTANGVQQLNSDGSWSQVSLTTFQTAALFGQSFAFAAGNFKNTNTLRGSLFTFSGGVITPVVEGTTFVAGVFSGGGGKQGTFQLIGYGTGVRVFGSLVLSSIPFGTLTQLFDDVSSQLSQLTVSVASDPGQSVFNHVSANGKTYTSAAASYIYGNGKATWTWAPFGFATGTTYAVVMA